MSLYICRLFISLRCQYFGRKCKSYCPYPPLPLLLLNGIPEGGRGSRDIEEEVKKPLLGSPDPVFENGNRLNTPGGVFDTPEKTPPTKNRIANMKPLSPFSPVSPVSPSSL